MRCEKVIIKSPLSGEVLAEFIVETHPLVVAEEPVIPATPPLPVAPVSSGNNGDRVTDKQIRA